MELFSNHIVVFLHVLSAIIWVGGMIAVRFAVHPVMQSIDDPAIKLGKTIEIVGRLFNIVLPFIIILLVTALLLSINLGFKGTPLNATVHIKEAIWTIMTINFTYMYIMRNRASKLFDSGDKAGAKASIARFPNLLLPINITLGIIALYLGVTLRGF